MKGFTLTAAEVRGWTAAGVLIVIGTLGFVGAVEAPAKASADTSVEPATIPATSDSTLTSPSS